MDPAGMSRAGDASAHVPLAILREQLGRILANRAFADAPTLGRLLTYLVDGTLDGKPGSLKEYAIAVEVLGRPSDFDPATDTIVRVHARRLRRRLEEYYAGDGAADPVRIWLPKGHYAVRWRRHDPVDGGRPGTAAPSIVVLPFATSGGEAEDEYFADGLTDEVICGLASLPGLRVVARTSAFQFKGRSEDVRAIGRQLGVQLVLEGSVRRDGSSVRVSVQLADTNHGFQQWARVYERDLTGIFSIQDEITRAIVGALRDRIGPALPQSRAPADAEAYDAYLRGRHFWNQATSASVASAIACFKRAIAIDPGYAAAHAGLADAYVFLATAGTEAPGPLLDAARLAARKALDLQDLAEGHSAMGTVLAIGDWDWSGAETEFRRALALMPSYALARAAYAVTCLAPARRHLEAIDQLRTAVALDPLSAFLPAMLGQVLLLAGRCADALDEVRRVLEIDPAHTPALLTRAWALLGRGDFAGAIAALDAAPAAAWHPNSAGHRGYALARLGAVAEAEDTLSQLLTRFPGAWVPAVDVAAIHSGLGNRDETLAWLERARGLRSFDLLFVRDDPRFADVQHDPRLDRILPSGTGDA